MNAKKLLGVAVPVMLLFGCGVSEKTKESKVKESKSNSKKEKVSKEDYPNKVYKLGVEFDKLFAEHNNITREVFDGKKKKSDIVDSVKELNKVLDKFESIDPPTEYVNQQKDFEKAISYFRESFSLINEVFTRKEKREKGDKTDKELIEKSEKLVKEGDIYWLKAFKDLEGDIKIGDGTVSMKDLKELDKKAGINTDNVMKNVKDGTELIGNWGFQGTDGFNMSLILKGDKTFETYGKGEYPNKKNYIEGTWEYDKEAFTIYLHLNKRLVDGVEDTIQKKKIAYKVQDYDGENLQLFNETSFNTIKYVKQS
ncbi:membrane protein [Bacillus wiedmannii]|nr:membrane protein [Bacillus wiedmannii]